MIKVLFVASECAPIAKVGGLGDVIGGLPKALAGLGVDARVVIPFYEQIDRRKWKPKLFLKLDNETSVYKTRLSRSQSDRGSSARWPGPRSARNDGRVEVFLIYNKKYLSRGPIYASRTAFVGSQKEINRFLFFSKAVFSLLAQTDADFTLTNAEKSLRKSAFSQRKSAIGWEPDVAHCNDWHTGFLVKLLKGKEIAAPSASLTRQSGIGLAMTGAGRPKVVFTIHNLANQGHTNSATLAKLLGVHESAHTNKAVNLMAEGIKNADMVTTVSPTYAKEILTKEYGAGLERLLRKRRGDLVGILNGIDYDFWPPYPRNKKDFQTSLNLKQDEKAPIFGLVSRLTYQKGINLVAPLVPQFVKKHNAQFVFLGQGEPRNEKALAALAEKYPQNVFTKIGFDEKLAHQVYAQSDFFLMPSLFEPSGLGQMISMHYGTIPIARATGGLKDTVKHLRTGFVFKEKTTDALLSAMQLAVKYFYHPEKLEIMRRNCLAEDFSWSKSAKRYAELYKKIVNGK